MELGAIGSPRQVSCLGQGGRVQKLVLCMIKQVVDTSYHHTFTDSYHSM